MKKMILSFMMLVIAIVVVACGQDNGDSARTAPTIEGVPTSVALDTGDAYDPLAGVTATDSVDGDLTESIVLFGLSACGFVDGVATTEGVCTVRYEVENSAGLKSQRLSTITITFVRPDVGDSLIVNGDFTQGTNGWIKGEFEGGAANVTVEDEELRVQITGVSWAGQASPRIHQEGIPFEQGKTYEVSFQARALQPRQMVSQVGELLPSAPWFVNFNPTALPTFDLTENMQTFSYTFTMNEPTTDNGSVTFELGMIDNVSIVTTVFIDNVSIVETEMTEDTIPPVFSGLETTIIPEGFEFDPLTGITAFDNVDGNVTDLIIVTPPAGIELVDGKVTINEPGDYVFEYSVSDAAGNEATGSRTITVITFEGQEGNLLENGDFSSPLGDTWLLLNEEGSMSSMSIVSEELRVAVTTPSPENQAFPRVWQEGITLIAGQTYELSFDARSDVARQMVVSVVEILTAAPWIVAYSQAEVVDLTTTMQTFTFTFEVSQATTFDGSVMFELGRINEESIATVVTIDNVQLLNITE